MSSPHRARAWSPPPGDGAPPSAAALCFALAPDASLWTTGYFATVGENIAPWVGVWATVAAAFSALNNIQPQMSSMARALRFTALYRMVPVPLLRRNWRRFNTPLPALICQGIVVGILMNFGFNVLVTINVCGGGGPGA